MRWIQDKQAGLKNTRWKSNNVERQMANLIFFIHAMQWAAITVLNQVALISQFYSQFLLDLDESMQSTKVSSFIFQMKYFQTNTFGAFMLRNANKDI